MRDAGRRRGAADARRGPAAGNGRLAARRHRRRGRRRAPPAGRGARAVGRAGPAPARAAAERREQAERFGRCIARRVAREPVSRILGEREFYGRSFAISPATLDPRPDSETLIEAALGVGRRGGMAGAAAAHPGCRHRLRLPAADAAVPSCRTRWASARTSARRPWTSRATTPRRLGVARPRAMACGRCARGHRRPVRYLDFQSALHPLGDIAGLDPEVRCFDPRSALDGGADGLRFFRRLAARMPQRGPRWLGGARGGARSGRRGCRAARVRRSGIDRDIRFYRDVAGKRRCVAARTRN